MSTLHFAEHLWLWGLCAIPLITLLYAIFFEPGEALDRLKVFIDAHLLPHLVRNRAAMRATPTKPLLLWSLIWLCGLVAMAGPRWNFIDVEANRPERELVILLDLSKSMDAQDVRPSRMMRARQEIEDIITMNHKMKIGLVAFAAVPHMVVPVTEDMTTLRALLPYLDTDLVHIQGSRLKPALEMATRMLGNELGDQRSVLIVSDGGFEDMTAATEAMNKDIAVYTLGIGTDEGAPIPATNGDFVKDAAGQTIMSRLETGKLEAVADAGHGLYETADYSNNDTRALLNRMDSGFGGGKDAGKIVRIWDEKFWIPALVMALCMLPLFRKGYVFPVVLLVFMLSATPAHAEWTDLFRNQDQQAQSAFDRGDYDAAAGSFGTPYRRGVAQYRAKKYDEAAKSFAAVDDPERRLDAAYNFGNAQLMANHPDRAETAFENYLKERPDDKAAQHNLDIAKKMLEQQKQKPQEQQQSSDQQQQQKSDQPSEQKQQSDKADQKQDGKSDKPQEQDAKGQNSQPKEGENSEQQKADSKKSEGQSGAEQKQAQDKQAPGQQQNAQQAGQAKEAEKKQGSQSAAEQKQQAGQDQQQKAQAAETDKQKQQGQQAQQAQQQQGQPKDDKPQPNSPLQSSEGNEYSLQNQRRTPEDVDADQWLSRAVSDPGPFLKNKFLMEERQSGVQPGDPQ